LLFRPEQAPHSGRLHGHNAHAVADDVVQLARDAGPLFGNCSLRALLALTFRPHRPFRCLVSLRELAPEREADDPDDGEQQADEDQLAELATGIIVDDDRFDADGHRETRHRLSRVAQLSEQKHRRGACEKWDEVEWYERVVREGRDDDTRADCERRSEREAPAEEQRPDDDERENDVDPERPLGAVPVALADNGARDRDAEPDDEQRVEPVAPRERPEPLHGLKVLRTPPPRLGREDEPRFIPEDEPESTARPKRPAHAVRTVAA